MNCNKGIGMGKRISKSTVGFTKPQNSGFTIIEVMIVLVIAAVIIMIVFFAVPALQRNDRNNRRKNDVAKLVTLIRECMINTYNDHARCSTPEGIGFDQSMFSIYTGAHYGQSVTPLGGTQNNGPTLEEPNWLVNTRCSADGSQVAPVGTTPSTAQPRIFVVGYLLEAKNQIGYVGRCIEG